MLQIGSSGNAEYYGNVARLNKTKIFFPWLVFSIFNTYLVLFIISITNNFHHLNNKLPESLFAAGADNKNWLSNLRQYGFSVLIWKVFTTMVNEEILAFLLHW